MGDETKATRWAMSLGLASILGFPLLSIFASAIRPMIDKASSERTGAAVGFGVMIVLFAISVAALIAGIRAIKQGERSRILWIGFVPAIFWLVMIIGEFIFPH